MPQENTEFVEMQKMNEDEVESLKNMKISKKYKLKGKWKIMVTILCIIGFTLETTNVILSAQCKNGEVKILKINDTEGDVDGEPKVMTDVLLKAKNHTTTHRREMCTERREFRLGVGEKELMCVLTTVE